MPDISTFGMAVNFTASTNMSAITAMLAPDPLGGDPLVNSLFPVGTAFKPTLGEGMSYHQDQLEWNWNKDFVVNYKALMQNRLNRLVQMLQQALDETLRRSMSGQVDDGTGPGINSRSAPTNPANLTGWKTATAQGGAMQQFEGIRTMAVVQKAVPVVQGSLFGLVDLGPSITPSNYDPINAGLAHRMTPQTLGGALMSKPGTLSGLVSTLADFLIAGKVVDEEGNQVGGTPFTPADPPAVRKTLTYEASDNDVGEIVETKVGTGAFWSTTNYLKQFRLDPTYSFLSRYTTESRNWYPALLSGGGPALFLRNRITLALRAGLGSWTMDYSSIPDIAPNVFGVPVVSILSTAPNFASIDIAGVKIPNPASIFGFPLRYDLSAGLPAPLNALAGLLTGRFRDGIYFGSDASVDARFSNESGMGSSIGGLDPYIGPNGPLTGGTWWNNSDPMDHPPPGVGPSLGQSSTGSVGIINDGNRSPYKNNLVVETANNRAAWSPGSNQQPYDLWGTVDESKGIARTTILEPDQRRQTTSPIPLNPDMLSNLNDGTETQETFGSYAGRVNKTHVVYASRIHQQDGVEDTTERLKNMVSQSYGVQYGIVDPRDGVSKTLQLTPAAYYDGTSAVSASSPAGGLSGVGTVSTTTLDDDINKYLKFQERNNARTTARLNPAFGNEPLGIFRGNSASTNYANPFIDTIAKVISDPLNAGIFILGMARDIYVTASVNTPLNDNLSSSIRLSFTQTGSPSSPGDDPTTGGTDSSPVDMLQNLANWRTNPNDVPGPSNNYGLHPTLGLITMQERYVSYQAVR